MCICVNGRLQMCARDKVYSTVHILYVYATAVIYLIL